MSESPEPDRSQIVAQVAFESARRARLAVPAVAGGVLYLLSGIILSSTLSGIPTVGVLQGVAPALRGEPNPPVSPRAAEIKFQSHHAFGLLAGSVLAAVAFAALVLVLLFLLAATTFRRPETNRIARPLVLAGGLGVAALGILTQVVLAIQTHNFATGHDFSAHAVDAVTHNGVYTTLAIVTPLANIALAAGTIIAMLGAVRVGLLPRWVGMVGGVSAVLLLLPTAALDVIPAFWLVILGILLMGRWPSGDPPAWAAGEPRPWPSAAEQRAAREAQDDGDSGRRRDRRAAKQGNTANGDLAPEPLPGAPAGTGRRRRKRGARR
jgi:hypothetical protein